MSYANPSDMAARFPNRDLVQITNEDPTVTTVNNAALTTALADASAEIDAFLGARFTLPLADPPAMLNRIAIDIAMYRLQTLRPLADVAEARRRFEDAIVRLMKIAAGQLTLGPAPDGADAPISAGAQTIVGARRVFSRRRLRGF
jgi:phage gp36-like protein